MSYTKDIGKMIIFFDDSKVTLYGEIVFNDYNELEQFIVDKDIVFTFVESKEIFENEYDCKTMLDEQSLNKLQKKYPKLYEKIKEYVTEDFYSSIVDDAINYVKKEHPELDVDEFEEVVDEVLNDMLQNYKDSELEKMFQYVSLQVTVVRDEQ
jgi:hypothetical protein